MPAIFESTFEVTAADLDAMQHVNNVRYLQWVQDVSEAAWTQTAKPEWLEQYKWVAINHFIEYKKPAFLGDQIQNSLQFAFDGFIVKCVPEPHV